MKTLRVSKWISTLLWSGLLAVSAATPPRLAVSSGAPYQLRLFGEPDQSYVIQATTDLAHWTSISTNRADGAGVADLQDQQSSQFNQRFYRAMLLGSGDATLGGDFRQDRILVKPLAGVDLTALHVALGVKVLRAFPAIGNLHVLQLPAGAVALEVIAIYQQSGLVEY